MRLDSNTPLTKAVPKAPKDLAAKLDLHTVGDLLRHYPRRYAQRAELTDFRALAVDEQVTIVAEVRRVDSRQLRNNPRKRMLTAIVSDEHGHQLKLAFFNAVPVHERQLRVGVRALFAGKVSKFNKELQLAHPESGIGTEREREHWQEHPAWQVTRKAVESALATYDWGEAFTALNLVLLPTIDDVLTRQFGEVALANGDNLSWLLQSFLDADNQRRNRWSQALAAFAIQQKPKSGKAIEKWVTKWSSLADDAAAGLGSLLESLPESPRTADDVAAGARAAREALTGSALGDEDRESA